MAPKFDVITALSQDSSPRIAGSEGEQKAALFIADQFKKSTHFSTEIDEFSMHASTYLTKGICALAVIVFSLLALVPIIGILFVILSLVAAVLYVLEDMNIVHLASYFKYGSSQNVVTRYVPQNKKSTPRSRKIVFLAHYDALRVKPFLLRKCEQLPVPLSFTLAVAIVAIPVFTFIHGIAHENLVLSVILQIVIVIAWLIALIPVVRLVMFLGASVSPSANCNASGVAALLELAHRISEAQANSQDSATIHGAQDAYEAGVVPDDAQLTYHGNTNEMQAIPEDVSYESTGVSYVNTPDARADEAAEQGASEREQHVAAFASAASAAPASMSGSSTSAPEQAGASTAPAAMQAATSEAEASPSDPQALASTAASSAAPTSSSMAAAVGTGVASSAPSPSSPYAFRVPVPQFAGASLQGAAPENDVPEWFKTAQEKAKKVAKPLNSSLRSRFADTGTEALKAQEEAQEKAQEEKFTSADAAQEKKSAGKAGASASTIDAAPTAVAPASDTDAKTPVQAAPSPDIASSDTNAYPNQMTIDEFRNDAQHQARSHNLNGNADVASPIANLASQESKAIEQAFDQPEPNCAFMENWSDTTPAPASNADSGLAPDDSAVKAASPKASASSQADAAATTAHASVPHDNERILVSSASQETTSHDSAATTTSEMEVEQAKETALDALYDRSALSERNSMKQPAPLASEAHSAESHRQLSGVIPRIDPLAVHGDSPSRSGMIRGMRGVLPSLSGTITRVKDNYENSPLNPVGSFAAGATESIKPITDEMLKDVSPDDMYVEDADDSDVDANYTDSGAPAGPDYVEMPKSRWQRFKQRFSRKKKDQLDFDDFDSPLESSVDAPVETDSKTDNTQDALPQDAHSFGESELSSGQTQKSTQATTRKNNASGDEQWEGGAFSFDELSAVFSGNSADAMDDIRTFKNGGYNTEVWFVALGAAAYDNGGMRGFYQKYAQELHGAIFVDVEALGAGALSLIYGDGSLKPTVTSGRLKRYVKKAQHVLSHPITEVRLCTCEMPGQVAAHLGCQHIQLAGTEQGTIAHYASKDDTIEHISEKTLEENIDYLAELARSM